jgi:hypothetical protein
MRPLLLVLAPAALLVWLAGPSAARGCPPGLYGNGYAPQNYGYGGGGYGYPQQQFYQRAPRSFELDVQTRGLLGRPRNSIHLREHEGFGGYGGWPMPYGYSNGGAYPFGGGGGNGFRGYG